MCFSLLCRQFEIKNLNSLSAMNRAIDFEISRQVSLHGQGQSDQIVQETRLWEEGGQVVVTSLAFPLYCFFLFCGINIRNEIHIVASWMLIYSSNFCCNV